MTNIMKAHELAPTRDHRSFEGWMATAMGAAPSSNAAFKGNVAKGSTIELNDFADLLEVQQSGQFDNVPLDEWDVFLASSDRMLISMQGCLPFIWGDLRLR